MLKKRIRLGVSVSIEIADKMKELSIKTMIPLSRLQEEAMKEYLKKFEHQGQN